ncbi:MAG: ABC transporter substrate-binding protein, partial [Planctomycetota bacterium]|nr:ABC transporter substrate-binding protein [Planctomycetota bacterium]
AQRGMKVSSLLMEGQGFVSQDKVTQVAQSLLQKQSPDGSFPGRDMSLGHVAVTAVALHSLKSWSHSLADQNTAKDALALGFDWLKEQQRLGELNSYEQSLVARTWLRFSAGAAQNDAFLALLKGLKNRQTITRGQRGFWSGQKTLTGTRQQVANVETTAIVAQVLLQSGQQDMAEGALQWLIGNRHPTRDFGGTRASIEALKAMQLNEKLGRQVIQGELIASVAGEKLATIPLSGQGKQEMQVLLLSALTSQTKDLDALISSQGLDLQYTGTGWFGARLVVRGVAPGMTGEQLLKPVGVMDQGLQIIIEKPTELAVGEGQSWTFEVLNRNSREISAPMLELELPAGFDIIEADWNDATKSAIVAFEQRAGRQVFYLKTLEAREQLSFAITIVPRREGRFWTGVTRAYPYYQPEEENILEPLQINVHRQSTAEGLTKHSTLKSPSKTGSSSKSQKLTPIRELDGAMVIAWDEASLGEMNLNLTKLPFGTKPIDQLVTRALFQGLPHISTVTVLKTGLSWEFELDDVYWSDGRDITVNDFLDSWNRARVLFSDPTKLPPFLDQKQTDLLHSMRVEVTSNQSLRIHLKEPCTDFVQRLNCTPFLPWSIWSDPGDPKRIISNGAYQLERADNEEIVLTRPGLKGQGESKILIRLIQKRDLKFRGLEESEPKDEEILERRAADLIWGYPSRPEERAGLGLIGVYLNGEAQHSQDIHVALRIVGEKVKDKRKWSSVSARSYWGAQAREIGRYSNNYIQLGYDRESLRDAADTLGHELREQGFSVTVENSPYTGLSEIPEILLSSGYRQSDLNENTSFRAFGRVPVHLGGTLKDIFKHALDRYGYLKFPARKAGKSKH